MSWYNTYSENTRQLEQLLDTKPTLAQLLQFPEFIETLKAFQPKVLDYISNSFDLPKQMIRYITEAPQETDSDARKFKLPLMTVMMIETNTTCVVNSFLKVDPQSQKPFFVEAFNSIFSKEQSLPLLCGYFSQMNMVLWNNRYRQVVDIVYDFKTPLLQLANHTYNKAIVNTLLLYLNLDMTRNPNTQPERTQLKLQILKILYQKIKISFEQSKIDAFNNEESEIEVENICDILIEIVEKYYLIVDGKSMLDFIATQENVELIMSILMVNKGISFSVVGFAMVMMRYYCLSSFNQEDVNNPELSKKNEERLEVQPFIKKITELIPAVSAQFNQVSQFTIYHSKLFEIFMPIIELSSYKIARIVRENKFFENILALMFKYPHLSILHKQVQRAFFAVFCSERKVCEEYRRYLFCEASIIEKTAGECLSRVDKIGEESLKLGWFSHLMKIVKVYSKIQTNDEAINEAIMQRATLWEKFSACLMRPYQALSFKELGSYEGLPARLPVEYTVKQVGAGLGIIDPACKKVIEELIKQESMQQFLTTMPDKPEEAKAPVMKEDSLFVVQDFQKPTEPAPVQIPEQPVVNQILTMQQASVPTIPTIPTVHQPTIAVVAPSPQKKEEEAPAKNFSDYFNSKKHEIENEIATQRKSSKQKRLSANKSRMASPSPKKKRWDDSGEEPQPAPKHVGPTPKIPTQDAKKQRISLTTASFKAPPSIPVSPRATQKQHQESHTNRFMHFAKPEQKKEEEPVVLTSLTSLSDQKINKSVSFDGASPSMSENLSMTNLGASRATIEDLKDLMSKSAINLGELKNMKVRRQKIPCRLEKSGRKLEQTDKVLLSFLGVQY